MSRVNINKKMGMQTVRPFRTEEEVDRCWAVARRHDQQHDRPELRWELLWLMGINTGLRISDLTRLKVKDVQAPKEWRIHMRAKKTGKELGKGSGQIVPDVIHKDVMRLTEGRNPEEWLFQSRQKDRYSGEVRPISRQRAWEIINEIARDADIDGHIGCHSLRKTFGMNFYRQFKDLEMLRKIFGHASAEITRRYIGMEQEEIDRCLKNFGKK